MGDDQHAATNILQGEIHLVIRILKDAHIDDLVGQPVSIPLLIIISDPEEHNQPQSDLTPGLALDVDFAFTHPLDNCNHLSDSIH